MHAHHYKNVSLIMVIMQTLGILKSSFFEIDFV